MVQVYDDENYFMSYRTLGVRSESLEVPIEYSSAAVFSERKTERKI